MEEKVKRIIWIDKNILSIENQTYLQILQAGVKGGKFYPVDSIEEAFDLIKNQKENVKLKNGNIKENVKIFQFRLFYVIVSGSLANEFFKEYVKTTLDYTIISANIIFCSDEAKHRRDYYYIDQFLNPGKVYDEKSLDKIIDFINRDENPFLNEEILFKNKKNYISSEKDYGNIFINVNNIADITFPYFFGQTINSTFVNENNLENFRKNFLLRYYPELNHLIFPSQEKKIEIPYYLLTKFFLNMYTYEELNFFRNMNFDLSNKKFDLYRDYIFLVYDALNKNTLKRYYGPLWRGTLLGKEEFYNIEKLFLKSKSQKYNKFNFCLSSNRSFLSFSKDKNKAINFMNEGNDKNLSILFYIEGIDIKNFNENDFFISNLDMQNISEFDNEKEVLVLPFSCFEIKSIEDSTIDLFGSKIQIKIITLNYLYKFKDEIYKYIIDIKDDKEKMESFLKNVVNSKFSSEIVQLIQFDIRTEFKKLLEEKFILDKKLLDFNIVQSLENCFNLIRSKDFKDMFGDTPSKLTKILIGGTEALKVTLISGKKIIMKYFPDQNKITYYYYKIFLKCEDLSEEIDICNLESNHVNKEIFKCKNDADFYDKACKGIEHCNKEMGIKNADFFEFYACGLALGNFILNYDEIKDEPLLVKLKSLGSSCLSMIIPFLPKLASKYLPKAIFKTVPYALVAINAGSFILGVKDILFDKSITKSETEKFISNHLLDTMTKSFFNFIIGNVVFKILVYSNVFPGVVVGIISIGVGLGISYLIPKIKSKLFSKNDNVDDLILFSESTYNQYIPRIFREFCIPTLIWKGVSDKVKSFAIELIEDGYRKWLVINIKKWIRKISNDNYMDVGETVFEYKGISKHPFKVCFILYECKKEKFTSEEWGIGEKKNENYPEQLSKYFNQVAELYLF